jgi:hypothetical protein
VFVNSFPTNGSTCHSIYIGTVDTTINCLVRFQ